MSNSMKSAWRAALAAWAVLVAAPAAIPFPQSAQTQNPPPKPAATGETKSQDAATEESDSVAEAARKAKSEKSKAAPKKVITDEDLSSLKGDGVSVVGDERPAAEGEQPAAEKPGTAAAKPGVKDEAYWRARAKQVHDQIARVDQEIEKTQDEIKKGGGAGFDTQTGLSKNVVYFEDRNTKLKKLEEQKAQLQKQLEDLEDEARKAGVPSGWLR